MAAQGWKERGSKTEKQRCLSPDAKRTYSRKDFGRNGSNFQRSYVDTVRGFQDNEQVSVEEEKKKVKVVGGIRPYMVKMEEDLNPVDIEWLERLLALRKNQAPPCQKSIQEGDIIQICRSEGVGGDISNSTPGADKIMGYKRINCQDFSSDKTTRKGGKGLGRLEKRGMGLLVKRILDKGKRKMIKWTKEKPMASRIQNGFLNLDKRRVNVRTEVYSTAGMSSSTEEEDVEIWFLDSCREKGESSRIGGKATGLVLGGLEVTFKPKKVSFDLPSEGPNLSPPDARQGIDIEEVLSNDGVQTTMDPEKGFSGVDGSAEPEFFSSVKEDMGRNTIEAEEEKSSAVVVDDSEEELVRSAIAVEDQLGGNKGCCSVPVRGMKLRNKSKSIPSSMHAMRTRNSESKGTANCLTKKSSAGEEAANIIATWKIIGLDFSRVEDEVLESITRREEEDNARFDAASKA
ncbi:hypothetical protein LWI29_001612 [Acer saccharum]|uniref:Uncharacterized protein n=1 Tax=Acer saccharum TaxID=4024 RepID=A0AA39TCG4_ACESA|nr:hypothetical protein LWI29_001612 [Acer saccharum]